MIFNINVNELIHFKSIGEFPDTLEAGQRKVLEELYSTIKELRIDELGYFSFPRLEIEDGRVITLCLYTRAFDCEPEKARAVIDVISKFDSLQKLRLDGFEGHGLHELPTSIRNLQDLQYLDLNEDHLSSLPESLTTLKNLKFLDLSANFFKTLPKWLPELKELQELRIGGNFFSEFPTVITHMTSLEALDLDGVWRWMEKKEYTGLSRLKSLKILYLSGVFEEFPEELVKLTNLEILTLHCGSLELPLSMKALKSLKRLDLRGNGYKQLPEFISHLKSLEVLNLYRNPC